MRFVSIQSLPGGRPVVGKFWFSLEDDPIRLVISNPSCLFASLLDLFSILVTGTNCNELGGGRRRLDSDSYYNTNRSRPVTVQCINTGVGAPVNRDRLTGMICPNRTLNSVRIIVPFLRMASSPVTISHQLILDIYILFNYTCHLGGTLQTRTYLIIRTH